MATWYFTRDGQQYGPYSEEDAKQHLRERRFAPDEPVWSPGMAGWVPAHTVFPAEAAAAEPRATIAAPPEGERPSLRATYSGAPPPYVVPTGPRAQPPPSSGAWSAAPANRKQRVAYVLLGLFAGGLGIHNFYAGYVGRGVAQLVLSLFLGWLVVPLVAVWIWVLVELFTVKQDARGVPFT